MNGNAAGNTANKLGLGQIWVGTPPTIIILIVIVVLYDIIVFKKQSKSIKAKLDSSKQTLGQISDGIALMIQFINKIIDDNNLAIGHIEPLEEYQTIQEIMDAFAIIKKACTGLSKKLANVDGARLFYLQNAVQYQIQRTLIKVINANQQVFVGQVVAIDAATAFDYKYGDTIVVGTTTYKKLDGRSISEGDAPYLYQMLQTYYHSGYVLDATDKQIVGVDVTKDPISSPIPLLEHPNQQKHLGGPLSNEFEFDFSDVMPEHTHTYTTQNWTDKAQSKSYGGAGNDKYKYMTNDQSRYQKFDFNASLKTQFTNNMLNVSDSYVSVFYYVVTSV